MADLWGRQDQVLNGGLSSDSMFVTWPSLTAVSNGGVGLLIQNIGVEYRQPVRRIFEIGPGVIPLGGLFGNVSAAGCDGPNPDPICSSRAQPTYYIIGRPEGQLQMGRFVGPNMLTVCFYRKYGSPCGSNDMIMSGRAGCNTTNLGRRMTWSLNGVLLTTESMDITAQEMVIQERLSAMFVGMNLEVEGDDGTCGDSGNQQIVSGASPESLLFAASAAGAAVLGGAVGG